LQVCLIDQAFGDFQVPLLEVLDDLVLVLYYISLLLEPGLEHGDLLGRLLVNPVGDALLLLDLGMA